MKRTVFFIKHDGTTTQAELARLKRELDRAAKGKGGPSVVIPGSCLVETVTCECGDEVAYSSPYAELHKSPAIVVPHAAAE